MRKVTLAALFGALLAVGVARSAEAVTMDVLLAGGAIRCGDKVFGNWRNYDFLALGGAKTVLPSEINVDAVDCLTHNPGLVFSSAKWKANAGQSQDTRFQYDVTVLPGGPPIDDHSISLISFGTIGVGDVELKTTLKDALGAVVAVLVTDKHMADAHTFIDPTVKFLTVSTEFIVEGGPRGRGGKASISDFGHHFSEVPEPGTVALLIGIGVSGSLFGLRLRRRR